MKNRALAAALATGIALGCSTTSPRDPAPDPQPVAIPAPAPAVAELDLFVEAPTTTAQLVFVDAQRPDGIDAWPGAVFVPLATFSVERDGIPNEFPPADSMAALLEAAGVAGHRFIVVGAPIPAGRAYAAFDYLGLGDRTALLDGGPAALGTAPAVPRPPSPAQGGLAVDVRQDMIVDADWVHSRLDDPAVVILDARPPAEYSGATPGEGIERPGHIPGARNVFWQTLVRSAEDPRLKDEAELRRIFAQAGVDAGDTVVAYCRTGGQASFLYTVARHLGYDVRLYDGSYIDWSRTPHPVER